jgi:hypothetical protein
MFLASDVGAAYTSQVLVVGGGTVQLIDPFSIARQISFTDGPPTVEEIAALVADVRGASAQPPAFALPVER